MTHKIKAIGSVLLALVVLVVIFQNMQQVSTRILVWTINMPRAALLLIAILIGFVLGQLFTINLKRRD